MAERERSSTMRARPSWSLRLRGCPPHPRSARGTPRAFWPACFRVPQGGAQSPGAPRLLPPHMSALACEVPGAPRRRACCVPAPGATEGQAGGHPGVSVHLRTRGPASLHSSQSGVPPLPSTADRAPRGDSPGHGPATAPRGAR